MTAGSEAEMTFTAFHFIINRLYRVMMEEI